MREVHIFQSIYSHLGSIDTRAEAYRHALARGNTIEIHVVAATLGLAWQTLEAAINALAARTSEVHGAEVRASAAYLGRRAVVLSLLAAPESSLRVIVHR